MSPSTKDIYTETADVDPRTLLNLGPLAMLAGTWEGRGLDVHPVAAGGEEEAYLERMEFVPIDPQSNGPQLLYGLRYHIHIRKAAVDETFHDQVGYWLWEAATKTITQTIAIPRAQVALASGTAEPDARRYSVRARLGSPTYGICSAPFLDENFKTLEYTITLSYNADGTLSYEQDTVLVIPDRAEPFHHIDRNTLRRVSPPSLNPAAARRSDAPAPMKSGETKSPVPVDRRRSRALLPLFVLFAFAAIRMWLVQPVYLIARDLPHDDLLYVRLARSIADGRWLGPFDATTLVKAPGYALWLALLHRLQLPPVYTEHAMYLAAVVIAYVSLVRAGAVPLFAALGMSALMFSPEALAADQMRLSRVFLDDALALLLLSMWLLPLVLRSLWSVVLWSSISGAVLAFYSLVREEFVWILPVFLLAIAVTYYIQTGRRLRHARLRAFLMLVVPIAGVVCADQAVRRLNQAHYGAAIVYDQRDGSFPRAMGALSRIDAGAPRRFVPISAAARAIAYKVSPAFAELRPLLEGPEQARWLAEGCRNVHVCDEISAGWIYFEIRDAAQKLGHYQDGATADAYFSRVASEVQRACENGGISCAEPHDSLVPSFHLSLILAWCASMRRALTNLLFPVFDDAAHLTKDRLEAPLGDYKALFPNTPIYDPVGPPPLNPHAPTWLLYAWISLLFATLITRLYKVVRALRAPRSRAPRSELHDLLLLGTMLCVAGIASRLSLLAAVDATSFRALGAYLLPARGLLSLWLALSVLGFLQRSRAQGLSNRYSAENGILNT